MSRRTVGCSKRCLMDAQSLNGSLGVCSLRPRWQIERCIRYSRPPVEQPDGHRSPSDRIGDEIVAVGIKALDGYEQVARPDLARVVGQPLDFRIYTTADFFVR